MVSLIHQELKNSEDDYLFIEFNAWLYQGFDDARASLMEAIARPLLKKAEGNESAMEKAKGFLKRVNWVRSAGVVAGTAASLSLGLPPVGLLGEIWKAGQGIADGDITEDDFEAAQQAAKKGAETGKKLLKPKEKKSPPEEIDHLRELFKQTLKALDVKLVVLVDDLDRCLPEVAISTLEAMRLFLFMENTSFIIAADDTMIRQAVRSHFGKIEIDDDLVTNYFDKLIQIPVRVPPLGTQEVRAFLFLLFVSRSNLPEEKKEEVRQSVCGRLSESWQGNSVDQKYIESVIGNCPEELSSEFELATRIAPLMTTSEKIRGNPRLIKRFLNTLSIRLAIAKSQEVSVDEAALAKMLLFERCGNQTLYATLVRAINESEDGKPEFLADLEKEARTGKPILDDEWSDEFSRQWLSLSPQFADLDLRGVVYASKDYLPIVSSGDHLSPEAVQVLETLLSSKPKGASKVLADELKILPKRERVLITEKVLSRARSEQKWGTPPALYHLLTLIKADGELEVPISRFFKNLLGVQIDASIVPTLSSLQLAKKEIFPEWLNKDISTPVKKAIEVETT